MYRVWVNASEADIFFTEDDYVHPTYLVYVLTTVYVATYIVGAIGNVLTCLVIALSKHMRTLTNYYLFNLAVADLLFIHLNVYNELRVSWRAINAYYIQRICWSTYWISETLANVSIMTISAFSIERYLAIHRPFNVRKQGRKKVRVIVIVLAIWLLAPIWPYWVAQQMKILSVNNETTCFFNMTAIPYSIEATTLAFFITPFTILVVLYTFIGMSVLKSSEMQKNANERLVGDQRSEGKMLNVDAAAKKTIKMLVAVVVGFFVCWAPFHIERLMAVHYIEMYNEAYYYEYHKLYWVIFYTSSVLYLLSAVINPVIYSIMSRKFRHAFKEVLFTIPWLRTKRKTDEDSDNTRS